MNYTTDDSIIQLKCGEEFGRFNMGGSTVIVLFGPGSVNWQTGLGPETRVQVGQALGRVQ
ncbi:phosphatidylserine decarboxylase [Solemya velum gill symbiont]|uniref:Phosphatidylserine decarboxylase n=1 Tax=Solemya velum gill symbiont TaxID=2340 RepID=A0A0B0HBM0_SOVGS|nr:phosphatidylserine decarboxylase [Solemya velum gill symbiont]